MKSGDMRSVTGWVGGGGGTVLIQAKKRLSSDLWGSHEKSWIRL